MKNVDLDEKKIVESHPVFDEERKLSDNLFLIRLAGDEASYVMRLYPLALFEVSGEITDLSPFELGIESFSETKPFSYFQPLLITTTECNLACTYCYAHEGSYGVEKQEMPSGVLDKTIDYLRNVILTRYIPAAKKNETTELGLICFGGEPLLAEDLVILAHRRLADLCIELSEVSDINFVPTLTINTNAVKVNKKMLKFLSDNAKDIELVVSYDGLLHDENRITKGGTGTAQLVYRNILRLRKAGVNITITSCVLPEALANPESLMSSLEKIYSQGIPINLSFIRGPLEGVSDRAMYPGFIQESYDEASLSNFGTIVADKISQGAKIYSSRYRRRLLEGGYRYRCGAGLFEFAVMPDGVVYPCHNFIAARHSLGNISEPDFAINESSELVTTLLNRKVQDLKPCSDCAFQSTCMSSFDCPAHSLHDLHDINMVDKRFCGFARKVQQVILKQFIEEKKNEQS